MLSSIHLKIPSSLYSPSCNESVPTQTLNQDKNENVNDYRATILRKSHDESGLGVRKTKAAITSMTMLDTKTIHG